MTTAEEIIDLMSALRNDTQRLNLMRFFKCGKGEYGEGDEFLGLKVPQTREIVKFAKRDVPFGEIEKLLYSKWHEVRLCGFLLLAEEMKLALPRRGNDPHERRQEIARFFLRHARQANNWDLVDIPCREIVGYWLLHSPENRNVLDRLAESENLWEQRISIVSTWILINRNQFEDTLRISEKLLSHPHDLIHKAVGWMLREVGKRDTDRLFGFLETHHSEMSRTTLRYAIEKLPEPQRLYWLRK